MRIMWLVNIKRLLNIHNKWCYFKGAIIIYKQRQREICMELSSMFMPKIYVNLKKEGATPCLFPPSLTSCVELAPPNYPCQYNRGRTVLYRINKECFKTVCEALSKYAN